MQRILEASARIIWEKYKIFKKGRRIIRSGYGLCGAYGDAYRDGLSRASTDYETILEHQAATAFLASIILRLFPEILPQSFHQHLIELMIMHDVVEVESGDLADDGHLDKAQKSADELAFMRSFAEDFNEDLLSNFQSLELMNGLPLPQLKLEDIFGQVAFIIDKMEAVLQLAVFELDGVKPNLTYKLAHFGSITERDQFYMELTNSDACLDVWMAHFYDFAKSYLDFDLAYSVTLEAYYEARGSEPKWIDKILAEPTVRCWPADRT